MSLSLTKIEQQSSKKVLMDTATPPLLNQCNKKYLEKLHLVSTNLLYIIKTLGISIIKFAVATLQQD